MMIAAPSHTNSGPPTTVRASATSARLARCSDSASVGGHETAQVDDAPHAGVPGRGRDVGGRGLVGVAEVGLTDRVDQVIHHVDRARGVRSANAACADAGSDASRLTGVTWSNQPKRLSRSGFRVAATTWCWSASSAVTSRDPT